LGHCQYNILFYAWGRLFFPDLKGEDGYFDSEGGEGVQCRGIIKRMYFMFTEVNRMLKIVNNIAKIPYIFLILNI
jgi:hypothetical protein